MKKAQRQPVHTLACSPAFQLFSAPQAHCEVASPSLLQRTLTPWSRSMVVRILYFGRDTCHRLPVLASAGYYVENCDSVEELGVALEDREEAAALLLSDREDDVGGRAIAFMRSHSDVPVVIFRDANGDRNEAAVDLDVPTLTPPSEWLQEISALIESRAGARA
jgi:hypothetical protein